MAVTLTTTSRDVMVTAFTTQLNAGHIILLDAVPETVATLIFDNPAFDTAATGSQEAGGAGFEITPDSNVDKTATAVTFQLTNAAETTIYATGTVSAVTAGGDIEFDPTNAMVATGTASISSMIVTVPATCS
jgi:hypothetical protein